MSTLRGSMLGFAGPAMTLALCMSASACLSDGASAGETRRWPAEIENVFAVQAAGDDAPIVQTDQRCATVQDGLAHCVMVECQTRDAQTACFEMVVTARRLRDVDSLAAGTLRSERIPAAPMLPHGT